MHVKPEFFPDLFNLRIRIHQNVVKEHITHNIYTKKIIAS
jgi:hypothetical protein